MPDPSQPGLPRLSLCMIVRDEEESLPRCLRSVEGIYDELVVVDTGSRDRTVAVARAYGARVLHYPWRDDFSAARNHGLDYATGDWILWLDADDELAPEDREHVRPLLTAADVDGYFLPTLSLVDPLSPGQHVRSLHLRLFRRLPHHRFRGAIHEYVPCGPGRYTVAPVRVVHHGYVPRVVQEKDKVGRNLRILRRLARAEPECALWHFYLGCELGRAGDWKGAAAAYERARELLGPDAGWAPDLWRRSAIAWMRVGDHGRAHAALQEGIARHPDYTDLHFLLGLFWHRVGRYGRALRALRRALELGEPPPWYTHDHGTGSFRALTALAQVHVDLGNWHEAADLAAQALRLQPDYPAPARLLVHSLRCLHPPRAAREALRAALGRSWRAGRPPARAGATPEGCGLPRPGATDAPPEPWPRAVRRHAAIRRAHPWHLPAYVYGARAWLAAIPPLLRSCRGPGAADRLRRLRALRLWRWEAFTVCD